MPSPLARRRLFGGRPAWVNPLAAYADDYTRGLYWRRQGGNTTPAGQLAVTRASGIFLPDSAGAVQTLGNNALPRTDRGLYANGQITNKCLNFNANPADNTGLTLTGGITVTQPVEAAMIAAAGLQNVCTSGRIYRAVADSSTNTLTINGTTGNTNPHTLSGWLYVVSGSVQIVLVGQAALGTVSPNAGLTRFAFTGTPSTASRSMGFRTTDNAEYYFILNQLQENSFASPPIVVAGGAATLLASDITAVPGTRPSNGQPEPFPGWEAAGLDAAHGGVAKVDVDRLSDSSTRFIAGAGVDASNLWRLIFDTDNRFKLILRKSASDVLTLQSGVVSTLGLKQVEWRVKPGDYALSATGVAGATSASSETLPTGMTALRIGSNFALASPFNGWIEELQILRAA